MADSIRLKLWKRQRGLCARFGKPVSLRGAHRPHRVPGSQRIADRELLHPRCHLKHVHGKRARTRISD